MDNKHIIQTTELSNRFTQDANVIENLIQPMNKRVRHITADAAYDDNPTYQSLAHQFPSADIIIPPQKESRYVMDVWVGKNVEVMANVITQNSLSNVIKGSLKISMPEILIAKNKKPSLGAAS